MSEKLIEYVDAGGTATYRDFEIQHYWYPVRPWCRYEVCHKDYDGPEDKRYWLTGSVEEAVAEIDEFYADQD